MKKGCKKTYSTYPSQVANVLLSTCRTRMVQHRKDIERHNLSCWQNRTKVDQPKQNLMGSKFFNRFPNSHILQVFTGHAAVFSQSLMQSALQKKAGVRERGTFPITCMLSYICWMSSRWLQREFGNRRDCNILGLPRTFADLLNLFSVGCSLYVYPQRFHVYMD